MGEPPAGINSEIDANYHLRRLYYAEAPAAYRGKRRVRVGDAVGASACVARPLRADRPHGPLRRVGPGAA